MPCGVRRRFKKLRFKPGKSARFLDFRVNLAAAFLPTGTHQDFLQPRWPKTLAASAAITGRKLLEINDLGNSAGPLWPLLLRAKCATIRAFPVS